MRDTIQKLLELLTRLQRLHTFAIIVRLLGQAILEIVGVGLIPVYLGVLIEPERILNVHLVPEMY